MPIHLPMRFANKIALITGGRSGIGKAIATHLESEGAKVFTAQRGEDQNFESIKADFACVNAPKKTIETLINKTGKLDFLVNNAGIMQEISIENMALDDWQRTLNINLTAPFLFIKYALPHLKKTQGNIVNIGSIEGVSVNPNHAAYGASKAGLHGLTRAVAIDYSKDGIRCNTVAPGWIDTDLNLDLINATANPEIFKQNIAKIHPIGRTGKPEEVAALVAFLLAAESGFITGQTYYIDGGRMAKLSLPF